ncbi:hypothetical protein PISL3812_08404 [Talaromyces islandicus]|uniref:D-xylose reductase [NAD(P)H] n=1 Tax=Talaromyces islandicus TaxID=28573 RepID=A0A0U1M8W4_TALIS|nr:hypothetical protein PISL3812_08404 [Talaromyces islandicus]
MAQKLSLTSSHKILSGYDIPLLGYGVYQVPGAIAQDVVAKALDAGYRHIDSAAVYGNERECSSAVKGAGLKRSDVFLTTKVLPAATGYEAARQSIEESLQKAEVDYFDLILLHAPFGGKEGRLGAWRALAEAQRNGKARSIGVSNFGIHHLMELEEYIKSSGEARIEVGQYELHPWLGRAELVDWLRKRNVVIEAYSPLARGTRMDDPVLRAICRKHNKSPAQVLIRWSLQKGFVPLPKSATPERIRENVNVFDFELDADDMKALHTDEYSPSTWDPTTHQD